MSDENETEPTSLAVHVAIPKPVVTMVSIHSWPYGDDKWIEVCFEGEHVHVLNVAYGQPSRSESIARAAIDVGAALNAWGVITSGLGVSFVEHDDPKREPRLGDFADTHGRIDDDGIEIEFGGAVPVQGNGEVDRHTCYYRSRGRGWSFAVWARGVTLHQIDHEGTEPIFEYGEDPYAFPDGGWVHREESIDNIRRAVVLFRARKG